VPLDEAVVGSEGRGPRLVAQLRRAFGRSDDVGEQHGRQHAVRRCGAALAGEERLDFVQHAVGVPGEPHVVVAVELHESCVPDSLDEILCVFATHVAVATPVQQQRRRLDALERGADVGAHEYVVQRLEISGAAGEPLTARPPAPLGGVARPAGRQQVNHRTCADRVLEAVDVPHQGRLRHAERLVRGAKEARERATEHE